MSSAPLLLASALLLLATLASPARAADEPACAASQVVPVDKLLMQKSPGLAHAWGKENLTVGPAQAGGAGPVVRVAFPAGSFSPGKSPIRGGAGFEFHATAGAQAACLSYKVRFPEGFDFVKGGKLPGLFGGDDPRGCVADDTVTGFSARLMWRTGGEGELYLYAPGREARCGQSIGRGSWTFTPGRWSTVTQRVVMNSPGASDGSVEVWVDGVSKVRADKLTLGTAPGASVDGLLFATFFGGGDQSWATPKDQSIEFSDFAISAEKR